MELITVVVGVLLALMFRELKTRRANIKQTDALIYDIVGFLIVIGAVTIIPCHIESTGSACRALDSLVNKDYITTNAAKHRFSSSSSVYSAERLAQNSYPVIPTELACAFSYWDVSMFQLAINSQRILSVFGVPMPNFINFDEFLNFVMTMKSLMDDVNTSNEFFKYHVSKCLSLNIVTVMFLELRNCRISLFKYFLFHLSWLIFFLVAAYCMDDWTQMFTTNAGYGTILSVILGLFSMEFSFQAVEVVFGLLELFPNTYIPAIFMLCLGLRDENFPSRAVLFYLLSTRYFLIFAGCVRSSLTLQAIKEFLNSK